MSNFEQAPASAGQNRLAVEGGETLVTWSGEVRVEHRRVFAGEVAEEKHDGRILTEWLEGLRRREFTDPVPPGPH
ncbi:MAG TPA: hypothetical protein EYP85_11925 [Armatimonadetes bacterium]|nr:hypothetical protein [Armatimonadota bacterium]